MLILKNIGQGIMETNGTKMRISSGNVPGTLPKYRQLFVQ